jgi:lactoylglutathione lyase
MKATDEGAVRMKNPTISLIVLRTSQMEAALAFYKALGLVFTEESHGTGPIHYSTQTGPSVLEIYPGEPSEPINRKAGGATMLGFSVQSLDDILPVLEKLPSKFISGPKDSAWGRRAVIADPDGRAVELSEPKRN